MHTVPEEEIPKLGLFYILGLLALQVIGQIQGRLLGAENPSTALRCLHCLLYIGRWPGQSTPLPKTIKIAIKTCISGLTYGPDKVWCRESAKPLKVLQGWRDIHFVCLQLVLVQNIVYSQVDQKYISRLIGLFLRKPMLVTLGPEGGGGSNF